MAVSIEQASDAYTPDMIRIASAAELVQGSMYSATYYDRYNSWMTYDSSW